LKRLPVIEIIKEALLMVWQERFMLFRALIATALAMAALDIAMRYGLKSVGGVSLVVLLVFLYWMLAWAVYTLFAVTCHRIVLLGETSVPKYGLLSWTSRETRFLGWLFVLFFYGLLIIGPVLLVTFGAVFLGVPFFKGYEKYWFFLGAVGLIYVFARLAVLFPATAIGERRNTDWAFETTAKNGWRLVAASCFPGPLSYGIHTLPVDHNLFTDFLLRLVDSALWAIGLIALSLSFRFLSMNPDGAGANAALQRTTDGGR